MQSQGGIGGIYVEKPAKTYTSIRLASHLVRAPNFQSEGREFEAPAWKWTRLSDNIADLRGSLRYCITVASRSGFHGSLYSALPFGQSSAWLRIQILQQSWDSIPASSDTDKSVLKKFLKYKIA